MKTKILNLLEDAGIPLDNLLSSGASITPNMWFKEKFPVLAEKFGEAIHIKTTRGGGRHVYDVSEDFLAMVLGELGTPEAPTVYLQDEGKFFRFDPKLGVYVEQSKAQLEVLISGILRECADNCESDIDVSNLRFKLVQTSRLNGVLERAKGLLTVPAGYFSDDGKEVIVCRNGLFNIAEKRLLPFSPKVHRRNQLGVDYSHDATCPMFLNQLLRPALTSEDIDLLQRWCGLALLGVNHAQAILIIQGAAATGKGTFVRIITSVLGSNNIASLRTKLLGERFEFGRMLGCSLLHGADVAPNFLTHQNASVLKSLTGGDPMTAELKGSNARPEFTARFNVLLTCNARLKVIVDQDVDAWHRRLNVILFQRAKPQEIIADLSERILEAEGPGVLNFMLEGLEKLRSDRFVLKRAASQERAVDNMLRESESPRFFVTDCLVPNPGFHLTLADAYEKYFRYCLNRGWRPFEKASFSTALTGIISDQFSVRERHDIVDRQGKAQRGWKGISCQ